MCMSKCFLIAAFVGGIANSSGAELLHSTPAAEVTDAGGFCDWVPDRVTSPKRQGTKSFETKDDPDGFRFVVAGDRFAARKGLGIGVRLQLFGYHEGQILTVQVDRPQGKKSAYEPPVGAGGVLEVGFLPAKGEALPKGRYRITVLDGSSKLVTYGFTLDAVKDDGLCAPVVS